jgi:hypothetical protein
MISNDSLTKYKILILHLINQLTNRGNRIEKDLIIADLQKFKIFDENDKVLSNDFEIEFTKIFSKNLRSRKLKSFWDLIKTNNNVSLSRF